MSSPAGPFHHEELPLDGEGGERAFSVRLTPDCPYFDGHFPGHPVLPAVAQLDILVRLIRAAGWPRAVATGLDGVRFRNMVAPGTRFELHFDQLQPGRPASFRLVQNGKPVSQGTLVWEES